MNGGRHMNSSPSTHLHDPQDDAGNIFRAITDSDRFSRRRGFTVRARETMCVFVVVPDTPRLLADGIKLLRFLRQAFEGSKASLRWPP